MWAATSQRTCTSQDLDEEEEDMGDEGGDAAATQQVLPGTTPVRRPACFAKPEPARIHLLTLTLTLTLALTLALTLTRWTPF